jgi:hypothetical protein
MVNGVPKIAGLPFSKKMRAEPQYLPFYTAQEIFID